MPRIPAAATKPQTAPPLTDAAVQQGIELAKKTKPLESLAVRIETIVVEIPLGPMPAGYVSSHLNSQLTVPQATGVARLAAGLRQSGTKMSNGRPVLFNADAVRWLLEQIAAA